MKDFDETILRRFARTGAEIRLRELDQERAVILGSFPDLVVGEPVTVNAGGSTVPPVPQNGNGQGNGHGTGRVAKRKKRELSAKERRHISERMTAYWNKRRADNRRAERQATAKG